jgi:amino acid adenylation domain-containing protein
MNYEQHLAGLSTDKRALLALDNPLSFAQERLWFLYRLEPDSPVYNIPAAFRLTGRLDSAAFERAVNAIVKRHESLRTGFPTIDGQPIQIISPFASFAIPCADLSALPETERETEARRLADEDARQPFDLARSPLLRVKLLRLGEQSHVALITMHHIVSDGWSNEVFLNELTAFYTSFSGGASLELPELPIQYADFAEWEQEWFRNGGAETQLSYWKQQLEGHQQVLDLPLDRPRPPVQTHHGASQQFSLAKDVSVALVELSRQQNVTLFMTLLAAFQTLLYRYSGQDDITVGIPVANRNQIETEGLIGFFVNMLALRTSFSGQPTFKELLARVKEAALGAFAHQQLPFEKLIQELTLERSSSHAPLVQVMFNLQNVPQQTIELEGLTLGIIEFENQTTKFDLAMSVEQQHTGEIIATIQYNTDIFDASTITRMSGHFQNLVTAIATEPNQRLSDLALLSEGERRQIVEEWNRTERDGPRASTFTRLFEAQVEAAPNAIALSFEEEKVSYGELDRRANQLARYLQGRGVGPEVLVGILLERSVRMVVSVLAVLKAGGAYMPLDITHPEGRLKYMLDDAGVGLVLTQAGLRERVADGGREIVSIDEEQDEIGRESDAAVESKAGAENLAYVIYTSGSTGQPKGAMIEHRGLCNVTLALIDILGIHAGSRVLQFASWSFDASVSESFTALLAGATLCLVPDEKRLPGEDLLQLLREEAITMATFVPSMLAAMPVADLPALETVLLVGEVCPPEVARAWAAGRRLFNGYGPTEATVCSTMTECYDTERKLPIGRPLANTQAYVLDEQLQPVAVGITGHLYVGGANLSRGYLKRADLTAERFIPHHLSREHGARLYRTGDLAKYLPDGQLEYVGRADTQVKVRGFRIELGEIEAALREHAQIEQAVVIVREDHAGEKRLVAYVVPSSIAPAAATTTTTTTAPTAAELRNFLSGTLPDYMLPSAFVVLESLPLNSSGKLDRKALPNPDQSRPELSMPFLSPSTQMEEMIAGIWAEVLRLDKVGVDDNFFDLGGHSLMSVRVHERIRSTLSIDVPLLKLFQHSTVRTLAAFLSGEQETQSATVEQDRDWAERRRRSLKNQRRMRS